MHKSQTSTKLKRPQCARGWAGARGRASALRRGGKLSKTARHARLRDGVGPRTVGRKKIKAKYERTKPELLYYVVPINWLEGAVGGRTCARVAVDTRVLQAPNTLTRLSNGTPRMPAKYHTPLLPLPLFFPISSIKCPIPSQEAGNPDVNPLGLRVSMGGGDHLLSFGSLSRL
ncbi:hypothetical protein EVAR_834_1 [Eumeta japonica]|uniref:Uncharacterized protein n=1 Tax=Eumeta variegata TaxID=151549 RepID=A0A4C1SFQ5_EUMVA|nr:hypothetical protein EVAR_834_1 [Eumeta japonica]